MRVNSIFGYTIIIGAILFTTTEAPIAKPIALKRVVAEKPVYDKALNSDFTNKIVFKLAEGMGQPQLSSGKFNRNGKDWDKLNQLLTTSNKSASIKSHVNIDPAVLNQIRSSASLRGNLNLPDLSLYYRIEPSASMTPQERLDLVNELNKLDIIEIAYFKPEPVVASAPSFVTIQSLLASPSNVATPTYEAGQYYLQPAPTGVDAYSAWGNPGGRGENVMVIDIEGNWVESHEDLHGGTDSWHIAGGKIGTADWYNHGTAVLGEIAADSNNFGMTGIAYNANLGTVAIGSLDLATALITAANASDTGDIILIELQYGGPNDGAYVPAEYYQDQFDAILTVTSMGRIVVEAGANGAQDLDNSTFYGSLFDPAFRFSGAIMVAASYNDHSPAPFTSHGQRLDVHAFGTWDVFTLGYGDLYGFDTTNFYTSGFSGTSSASPIIVGSCAILQSVHKTVHGRVLDHNEMRTLLQTYSTPQQPSSWLIGPLPDLAGSVNEVVGVSFFADTNVGWVPFDVNFTASSGLAVDTWTWDFGDGSSGSVQNPTHTYSTNGIFDVSLQIDAAGDIRATGKNGYIIALADSLISLDSEGQLATQIEVVIRGRNSIPLRTIEIPIDYSGNLDLDYISYSTAGCRTDYFQSVSQYYYSSGLKRTAFKLTATTDGTSNDLPPGEGDLLKITFTINGSNSISDTTVIDMSGFSTYAPRYLGTLMSYTPIFTASTVSVCFPTGDFDIFTPGVTVGDLTYLVEYLFQGGIAPIPLALADVNCSGAVDVNDVTYLVQYLFQGGTPPCGCN